MWLYFMTWLVYCNFFKSCTELSKSGVGVISHGERGGTEPKKQGRVLERRGRGIIIDERKEVLRSGGLEVLSQGIGGDVY